MKSLQLKEKKFGTLTVLDLHHLGKQNRTFWRCFCACGSFCVVQGRRLTNGSTKSCGCSRRANIVGEKFGELKVLRFSHKSKNKSLYWLCKCSCGKEKVIRGANLMCAETKSCGCQSYSKERYKKFKQTCLNRYGVDNPTKLKDFTIKAARSANKITDLRHWLSNETIPCRGSYEVTVVNYLNKNKIDYLWEPQTFLMPDGRTYTPDLYLVEEDKWVEVKGYFWEDAKEKWDWFNSQYDSELWNKNKLKEMNIL